MHKTIVLLAMSWIGAVLIITGCAAETPTSSDGPSPEPGAEPHPHYHASFDVKGAHLSCIVSEGALDLLVMKDFDLPKGSTSTSGIGATANSATQQGTLPNGKKLHWEWNRATNTLSVNDTKYSLDKGRVVLIRAQPGGVDVKQLEFDLSTIPATEHDIRDAVMQLANDHNAVRDLVEPANEEE